MKNKSVVVLIIIGVILLMLGTILTITFANFDVGLFVLIDTKSVIISLIIAIIGLLFILFGAKKMYSAKRGIL